MASWIDEDKPTGEEKDSGSHEDSAGAFNCNRDRLDKSFKDETERNEDPPASLRL